LNLNFDCEDHTSVALHSRMGNIDVNMFLGTT